MRRLDRAYFSDSTDMYDSLYNSVKQHSSISEISTGLANPDCRRLDKLALTFSKGELSADANLRKEGLSDKTINWLNKSRRHSTGLQKGQN